MGTEESRIKRLRRVRTKVLGEVPKSRDSFKPQSLLSKLPGGQNIIILNSNNDLPSDWVERCSQVPSNNPNKWPINAVTKILKLLKVIHIKKI